MKHTRMGIASVAASALILAPRAVGANEQQHVRPRGARVAWVRPDRVRSGQRATLTRLLAAAIDGGLHGFVVRDSRPKLRPTPDLHPNPFESIANQRPR
jgi:hypothetical protein